MTGTVTSTLNSSAARAAAVLAGAVILVGAPGDSLHATPLPAQVVTSSESAASADVTTAQLQAAASRHVVFGHQSVGFNILGGVDSVYSAHGLTPPKVIDWTGSMPSAATGWIAHAQIGQNSDPASKVRAFEGALNAMKEAPDAALMKLCYVDITADTKVKSVFTTYRRAMARLKAAHPETTILHATVPLTAGDPASNVKRQQYNRLIRSTYRKSSIVDIARVESTTPTGKRVTGKKDGRRYFALYRGYTEDGGHLNSVGSGLVAAELLRTIARS